MFVGFSVHPALGHLTPFALGSVGSRTVYSFIKSSFLISSKL